MRARLTGFFEHIWYRRSPLAWLLVPISWLYAALSRRHRRLASARSRPFAVPVIVVGNLTVGGTGKTPVVVWLCEQLREHGLRPGIVTRGYHGRSTDKPLRVSSDTLASEAGDEAVLLARRAHCPVVACADRVAAAKALIEDASVDVIVSDDGLQHYALHRDCEIVVVDGARGIGNARLLPAGPLREHPRRLSQVDIVLVNGSGWTRPQAVRFEIRCTTVEQISDGEQRSLVDFDGVRVHAHAAIGNPERYFAMLRGAGCIVDAHAWPDHSRIPPEALVSADGSAIMLTQKDAVKLLSVRSGIWSVNVDVEFAADDAATVLEKVLERIGRSATSQ